MINWKEVSDNEEVIRLIKQIEELSKKVVELDEMALLRYHLEVLNQDCHET